MTPPPPPRPSFISSELVRGLPRLGVTEQSRGVRPSRCRSGRARALGPDGQDKVAHAIGQDQDDGEDGGEPQAEEARDRQPAECVFQCGVSAGGSLESTESGSQTGCWTGSGDGEDGGESQAEEARDRQPAVCVFFSVGWEENNRTHSWR